MGKNRLTLHNKDIENQIAGSADVFDIRAGLWQMLAEKSAEYTSGRSSSLPKEIAQRLLESLCFTMGLDPDKELPAGWQERDLHKAYEEGRLFLEEKVAAGGKLWKTACLTAPEIDNVSFVDTLKSIGTFRERYDMDLFAHEIPCDIDYQLCHPVPESFRAADYINEYLRRIIAENDFLKKFRKERIIRVLKNYCPDYRGQLIGMYEPVAVNAVGLAVAGGDMYGLLFSESDRRRIGEQILSVQQDRGKLLFVTAAETVCSRLGIRDASSEMYLADTAADACPRIWAAAENDNLENVFL